MFYGLCNLPWWGYPLVLLALTHVTILGVTIFLHRHQAHRALDMHPALAHFFRFWLWLTTGMITKEWAAIHRKHHAKCETADDPHSPQVLGLPLVMWHGTELYRRESRNMETMERYGQGTPDDAMERFYQRNSKKGITAMLIIDLVLFGVPGLAIWALQMAWIPFWAAGVVNGVGHFWGYRNFECPDEARNVSPWGIFIGGEELHNNHHTFPTSAKLSVKWWEIDSGWFYIRLFEMLGLAKVKRVAPEPQFEPGKAQVDLETLKALLLNRFQIMARYSREVIAPVFAQEAKKMPNEASILSRAKKLLVRESSLLDEAAKVRLEQFLQNHKMMQVVYQFKERLHDLWAQTTLKEKEMVEALQKWCAEAEATGVSALREFSEYLKSLTLKTA
ncbi:MAG: fatty acid desaturase [Candidatus Berkiella sp.]